MSTSYPNGISEQKDKLDVVQIQKSFCLFANFKGGKTLQFQTTNRWFTLKSSKYRPISTDTQDHLKCPDVDSSELVFQGNDKLSQQN